MNEKENIMLVWQEPTEIATRNSTTSAIPIFLSFLAILNVLQVYDYLLLVVNKNFRQDVPDT